VKVTSYKIVRIENVPLTPNGRRVYEAILKTGLRRTAELAEHLGMSEGVVDLMLAHLVRHDLVEALDKGRATGV
jgi:predicted transcriptional regulator